MYGRGGRDGGGGGRGTGRRGGTPSPRGRQGPGCRGGGQISSVTAATPPTQRRSEAGSSSTAPASVGQPIGEELQTLSLQTQTPVVTPVAPANQKQLVASPTKVARFPARPGLGTVGAKCLIKANHFLVELEDRDMHHYDVSITPELTSRGVNRAVMTQLLADNITHFGKRKPAYDGRKGFYTAGPLPFTSKDFVVKLIDRDRAGSVRREREFKVTVKLASTAHITHLREFLRGRHRETPHDTIQVLDIVLREAPSKNHTVVGRCFFGPDLGGKQTIGNGVECWKGFYQSIRPTQMGMSLNMDISVTSFYEPISVIDFVARLLNLQDPLRDASKPLSDLNRAKVRKALKGVRVKVSHGVERFYKIIGLTSVPTKQLTFPTEDKTENSVVQYFLEKYKIRLQFCNWPALQSGNASRQIFLPIECCTIVEGQRYSKKLNDRQVTALLREACKRPNIREANIEKIAGLNNYEIDDLAKEFGVNVKKELTCIESRLLPPPVLKYHDSGRDRTIRPRVGQWNMINAKLFNGATVNFWACVNFSSLNGQMASGFCRDLVNMCRNKGMVISPTPVLATQSSHPNSIEKTLADIHSMCIAEGKPLQLLIVVLPDFTGSYGRIKRVCETELGIVSQCCQPKHAKKCSPQYLENVALKINVKAGGRNLVLDDALYRKIPLLSDHPTIIFGADVTHPNPGEDSIPSISAVVASMDWSVVTTYRGIVSAQQHREEIIQDCSAMVKEQLKAFRIATKLKPARIIFYRDGVSEGQFSQVLLHETEAIRKPCADWLYRILVRMRYLQLLDFLRACASLELDYQPPITFVVVQKRHHTRFFATDCSQTDKSGNVLPGTVVDTKICHPSEFDFYLCSHAGIQGTSRPAHYHVLYDENNFTADNMQTLTNNLCYTYARCTRSVSVVPPAYYAHLAAFRARYYIEGDTVSDSASSAGGGVLGIRKEAAPVRPLPAIKDNVKNVMFYC